jgi:hypothetical protein
MLLSAAATCWWWWLAPCLPSPPGSAPGLVLLLLDLLLITCPSPPRLDLELQYILIVLLDDFYCLSGAVQELVMFLVMFPCWSNGSCFSWWCSSSQLLGLQAAVVLPAPASQSCDWAACVLCACFLTQFDLILSWLCCEIALHPSPVNNRTDSILGPKYSMMQMAM